MTILLGTDIESVARFGHLLKNKPELLKRIFHNDEYNYSINSKHPDQSFTGTWCAKEAVVKSFGEVVLLTPRCVEIYRDHEGRPHCIIRNEFVQKMNHTVRLSISHTKDFAISSAILILS